MEVARLRGYKVVIKLLDSIIRERTFSRFTRSKKNTALLCVFFYSTRWSAQKPQMNRSTGINQYERSGRTCQGQHHRHVVENLRVVRMPTEIVPDLKDLWAPRCRISKPLYTRLDDQKTPLSVKTWKRRHVIWEADLGSMSGNVHLAVLHESLKRNRDVQNQLPCILVLICWAICSF